MNTTYTLSRVSRTWFIYQNLDTYFMIEMNLLCQELAELGLFIKIWTHIS